MKRRTQLFAIVLGALFAIGLISRVLKGSMEIILAVIVFGGVFLLWKFPPSRWKQTKRRGPAPGPNRNRHKEKRKHVPFRVIQGNKRDDDDDPDKPPLYH